MRKKLQCRMSLIVITVWFIGWAGKPLLAMNVGGGGTERKSYSKMESVLGMLTDKYSQDGVAAREFAHQRKISFEDDRVTVILVPPPGKEASAIDEENLSLYGATVEAVSRYLIRAKVPISKMVEIAENVAGISYIRLPLTPIPGEVTSEGVSLTGADDYHSAGYEGQNTKVAVIDLGFNELEMLQDIGELPSDVITRDFTGTGLTTGSPHGTRVAQIVYDMAPRTQFYFIKIGDEIDLENAKDYCITEGVHIINHCWGWPNTNFTDGTGLVCGIANDARSHGILWVNAAGNAARQHYQDFFSDIDGNGWHEFAPGDETNDIQGDEWSDITVVLTWNAWPTTDQDYDLYLYDSDFDLVVSSTNVQTGTQPPTEKIVYRPSTAGTYHIMVKKSNATLNQELKIFTYGYDLEYRTSAHSIWPPADALGVMSVAAINQADWETGPQESYSSQGSTNDGRIKPDIGGPDGVSRYAGGSVGRGYGTSYAAPHVAGAASLLLSRYPAYTADQLRSTLENWAIDMGQQGKDNIYGSGRLNLSVNQPPNTPSNPSPTDGATNQSIDVNLSWSGGDPDSEDTVIYDVYFEANDSSPDQLVSNDQSRTTYDPGTLSYNTHYYWKIVATDNQGASTEGPVWDFTTGSSPNNPPNTPSAPDGPNAGTVDASYDFTTTTTDPDEDQVAYKFDWGDASQSDWTDFVDSGTSTSASHSWASEGTYEVKVKAKDTNDVESGWSEVHTIVISRANQAPLLSWTGEPNYTSDGLNPEEGSSSTNFIYRVKYTDQDNDPPKEGYPKLHVLKGGSEISGSPFTMDEVDSSETTYTDGKLYSYTRTGLHTGKDYSYYFEAKDLHDVQGIGAPTSELSGPNIVLPANLENLIVYPNPFKPALGHTGIVFAGLTTDATIRIFDLSGQEISREDVIWQMSWTWNVKNREGEKVARGIYIYLVTNSQGEKKSGKIAVVK